MDFPERFSNLPAYAFPRLRALLDHHQPGGDVVHMTIGAPTHDFPAWVTDVIMENASGFQGYPPNEGSEDLRGAITDWIHHRYGVQMDPDANVMALNGTREGLYNAAMALCPEQKNGQQPIILCPNPFYQVYMVASLSVGAQPYFVPATAATGHLPDYAGLPAEVLNRTAVAYICSPANPQGAVASRDYWAELIRLAEQYDFRIFADECYSEIYRDTAPTGILTVAQELGADPERITLFNSLSKRSNLAGLRSGLIAGGPETIKQVKQLRTYAGSPLPLPLQAAAAKVWADEEHVRENRALYQEKYAIADEVFAGVQGYMSPKAGFFLWLPVDNGEDTALKVWKDTGVRVLPGAYLSQGDPGNNPGKGFIRVALVAPKTELQRGLITLRDCIYS
ncbi:MULTISPECIES: aminotransferase class I/II-fold pyridoxal phosphate-dependent enzyme [unclassified Ruegeria]|uniref:aminotransferase class I/II-fold pyridoxal phosphate-dependent enzyme n=1 Tax=unclassified Ruegeria TaxID=2625375 RepID=UPI0014882691|nr:MULTISPECIES: aminotransferase class I/II-fold pyridoxal phosphate-dependent enzyme [unclassified Ruegeria]NOD78460.1 aminotransferase class I/II-fold pyridoxal phosphate-dependent enzyme [Ruegeria sp. HKCCD4332]NOD90400.1 aminotransferase class I/II-fold pyridoxal phosphate-dependent enzyme [Ruegeria sp. HKCCD4318]NOE15472.1 aminotransferase class I/II-fold pyridoxal phosphate-dependent enzyme [Ruegeria sp. HKCCD4318-2]NOG10314.1 aminotransferase class I/II-fold pyridoxal phosphate-dependen